MAEVPTNVYNIFSPSPPALKEIVYASIAVQLWRQEINSHRIKNSLSQLNLRQNILSNNSVPGIAATDLSAIKKCVRRVGLSIEQWLQRSSLHDLFKIENLNDFIDFAVNLDGTIDLVKTAQRIVNCEKIEQILRFKIASRFCFEDDILRIWPSVSSHVDLKSVTYGDDTLLYYWICRLRNQLYRFPRSASNGSSIEEEFLNVYYTCRSSAVKYFWNRLDADSRMRILTNPPREYLYKYYRYVLPTFNEIELNKFVNTLGRDILFAFLRSGNEYYLRTGDESYTNRGVFDEASRLLHAMSFWTLIKTRMDENTFFSLVREIILRLHMPYTDPIDISTCCKLWNTAPDNLKMHAIRQLLLGNPLFQRYRGLRTSDIDGSFALTVLSDASAEDKNAFWDKYWRNLIDIMCTKDFDQLMRLCFSSDENQIVDFKQNTLRGLAQVRIKSSRLLNNMFIEELNQFLSFCYPNEQTRKNVRLNLLLNEFKVGVGNITKISSLLSDFISDAYDDVNLAEHFKTQLLFSPSTVATFAELIESPDYDCNGNSAHKVSFIDALAPSEPVARHLKKLYFSSLLKQKLLVGNFKVDVAENEFSNFIQECFTTEDETTESKEKLSVDEIVQHVIRSAIFGNIGSKYAYNSFLVQFLEWYFITPQALEQFKAKYVDDEVFVQLTSRSK